MKHVFGHKDNLTTCYYYRVGDNYEPHGKIVWFLIFEIVVFIAQIFSIVLWMLRMRMSPYEFIASKYVSE